MGVSGLAATNFRRRALRFIAGLPAGKVASYGQVAAASGSPRAARQVGFLLSSLDPSCGIPWWRVVNRHGALSIKGNWQVGKEEQKKLLQLEGVEVSEEFRVDLDIYGSRRLRKV